jgi:hypothetical protein
MNLPDHATLGAIRQEQCSANLLVGFHQLHPF